jgi:DNA-binding NtrC family response regulator
MVRHTVPVLAPGAIDALMTYDWPGNVREVENAVERALILSDGKPLKFDGILGVSKSSRGGSVPIYGADQSAVALKDVEADHIRRVLETAGGKIEGQGGAAEILGMNPGTLRHRMRKLGIPFGRRARARSNN